MYKKRGVTLLELVIYMLLFTIIFSAVIKMILGTYSNYERVLKINLDVNQVEEFYSTVDRLVRNNGKNIRDIENTLTFTDNQTAKIHVIKLNYNNSESKKNIEYFTYNSAGEKSARNVMLKDVEDFTVTSHGKLIYLEVKKDGISYEKAL